MLLLVALTLATDDAADVRVVIGAAALGTIWAGVTVFVGWRTNELGMLWFVLADGAVVFVIGAASTVSGAQDLFHGGYLLSWIVVAAYAGGLIAALGSSVVLMIEQGVVHVVDDRGLVPTAGSVMFLIFAIVVGGAFNAVRLLDRQRRAAEEELVAERAEAARLEERFELADQLHDSVLQTLHAIRLTADDAGEVRHLARSQARELRRTIAEMRSPFDDSLSAGLLGARDEVEDLYRVEIDAVIRSDAEVTDQLRRVVDATREAMVNAAKHSSDDKIELFSEIVDGTLSVYVRDRGTGFDPDRVDPSHGIGRHMAKVDEAGGSTTISSKAADGTEITFTMTMP